MGSLILRRLAGLIPLMLIVSFGVFALIGLVPGDPAVTLAGGEFASEAEVEAVREEFHLDDPIVLQYGRWLVRAAQLDFGNSLVTRNSVVEEVTNRLPITFPLALAALAVGLVVGIPAGLLAGMRPGTLSDRIAVLLSSVGLAVPNFWLAMILVTVFSINLEWLPALGYVRFTESPADWLRSLILPALSLGVLTAATVARQLRAALIEELNSVYVRTAWAKGGGAARVVGKHALKNAAIPVTTVIGLQLTSLLGGAVIIEQIFSLQGLGSLLIGAVLSFDLPVVQGALVLFILIHVVLSLIVDSTYEYLSPKVRVT